MRFEIGKAGLASAALIGATLVLMDPGVAHAQKYTTTVQTDGEKMVTGSGMLTNDKRALEGAVNAVVIQDATDLVIKQGDDARIAIKTDTNIADKIVTRVVDGTLVIESTGSYRTRHGVRAVLTVPSLDAVVIRGSGDVEFKDWQGEELALTIEGSGDIKLKGDVSAVRARVSGSGDIDLRKAAIGSLDAMVNGSGDIRAGSPARLAAEVNGSGDINYDGSPTIDKQVVNGTGDIRS